MKQSGQDNGQQNSILLVDDDCIFRQIVFLILQNNNFIVHEAVNGKDALSIYKSHAPDLVLTDVNMPEMDGVELTAKIRESNLHIPIIVMSADEENFVTAEKVGANMTFSKSNELPLLLGIVGAFLL